MHSHFAFSPNQILWTVTFAAQLILLVVLLGRERSQRFPVFTASISLAAMRLLCEELLSGRLQMLNLQKVLLSLTDVASLLSLLVVVEIARSCFPGAGRKAWLIAAPAVTLLAVASLFYWGPWPNLHWSPWPQIDWSPWLNHPELALNSPLTILRLMQIGGQKIELLAGLLVLGLGLLVLLFGRRFKTGWRSHSALILIGLAITAAVWLSITAYWQHLNQTAVHPNLTLEEYQQLMAISARLFNGNRILVIAVTLGWIASLWIDEPGAVKPVIEAAEPGTELPAESESESSNREQDEQESRREEAPDQEAPNQN
jgi:hypothetical protein